MELRTCSEIRSQNIGVKKLEEGIMENAKVKRRNQGWYLRDKEINEKHAIYTESGNSEGRQEISLWFLIWLECQMFIDFGLYKEW